MWELQFCGLLLRKVITLSSLGYFGKDRSAQREENGGSEKILLGNFQTDFKDCILYGPDYSGADVPVQAAAGISH